MEVQSLTDRQRIKRAESKNIGPDDPAVFELTRPRLQQTLRRQARLTFVSSFRRFDVIDAEQSPVAPVSGSRCAVEVIVSRGSSPIRPFA
jgi:hypothetical protein